MTTWIEGVGISTLRLTTGQVKVYGHGANWYYNVNGCSFGPHDSQEAAKEAALTEMQRRISVDAATILTMRIGTP